MDGEVSEVGWGVPTSKRGINRGKIIRFDVISPFSALQGGVSSIPHPTSPSDKLLPIMGNNNRKLFICRIRTHKSHMGGFLRMDG